MTTKLVLVVGGIVCVLAMISAGYCFWLMDHPLSYRWIPVVESGFLLAVFVFTVSLIISSVALVKLCRSTRPPTPPPIRPAL
jgi:membrane protein implicated in regulation of membrane protease activity